MFDLGIQVGDLGFQPDDLVDARDVALLGLDEVAVFLERAHDRELVQPVVVDVAAPVGHDLAAVDVGVVFGHYCSFLDLRSAASVDSVIATAWSPMRAAPTPLSLYTTMPTSAP